MRQAFRKYLECGIFVHGFARARCDDYGYDYFVVFSCKGRGVCPSCNTRRMVETAALHIGAIAFIHRFGSSLNGHVHFHVCVVHGVAEDTGLPGTGYSWPSGSAAYPTDNSTG